MAELGAEVGSTHPRAACTLGVLLTIWPGLLFPYNAVKEHLATESEGKFVFLLFLALFVLPELMAGKEGLPVWLQKSWL